MENRTIFDTNIWITYIINDRYDELAALVEKNRVCFLRSIPSLEEFQEVLSRKKFQKYGVDVNLAIAFYKNVTTYCATQPLFTDCPDPKDNFLFDLALQGNAKYLVSGDKKVLDTPVNSETLHITTLTGFKEVITSVS
jgi:putative PIN family toxin of toxin-antitoxin system